MQLLLIDRNGFTKVFYWDAEFPPPQIFIPDQLPLQPYTSDNIPEDMGVWKIKTFYRRAVYQSIAIYEENK